ncbi:uromodulin-like [Montipora capricornis]|uniref:uromodulin-like n=1 Tax=Montipora capricornis TaxID=246305 RepID=UPI0035F20385
MASSTVELEVSHTSLEDKKLNGWKMSMRRFGNNATTRNIVDLILVIAILVLLTLAAPVIRGDCNYDAANTEGKRRTSKFSVTSSNYEPTCGNCGCHPGFTREYPNCTDIDECSLGNSPCQAHSKCINLIGSYTCECLSGFSGKDCFDIDECNSEMHDCDEHATCTNTIGSYTCACDTGFRGDGISCKDKRTIA